MEGGIDGEGIFYSIPIKNTSSLTEIFRRRVISYFVNKKLLNEKFAGNLLSWKHSGFSVDYAILIPAQDQKARTGLSQYIARHPVSLNKIILCLKKHKYCTRQNIMITSAKISRLFTATDFIARYYRRVHNAHST